jgi:hypothetical protein
MHRMALDIQDQLTPVEADRLRATSPAADTSPSARDAVRAFGVMLGPSLALHAAWGAGAFATARAVRRGRVPGRLALALVSSAAVYRVAIRPWLRTWGATPEEQVTLLPGDEEVPDAVDQTTRAITMDAPIGEVWPWLAQLGQDRAGFYSYRWLEDLAGCRMPDERRIHPEWQRREVGETLPLHPATGLEVRRFEPPASLALAGGWSLTLRELPSGRTRLLARGRTAPGLVAASYAALLELPHFVMERKMLLGIRQRAEARPAAAARRRHPSETR